MHPAWPDLIPPELVLKFYLTGRYTPQQALYEAHAFRQALLFYNLN